MMNNQLNLKFIIIGDSTVGKTSLLNQYVIEEYREKLAPTVGVDVFNKELQYTSKQTQKTYNIHLHLWDTAGQERFRCLTNVFFRNAIGFILVFDLTNESSFLNVRQWLGDIESNVPFDRVNRILIGNKCDLSNERVISESRAQQFAAENNVKYIETSAALNINVIESIELLLNFVVDRHENEIISKHRTEKHIKLVQKPSKVKSDSSCCSFI